MNDDQRSVRPHPDAIAAEVLIALDTGQQIAPFSQAISGFNLDVAYAVTAAVGGMRRARIEPSVFPVRPRSSVAAETVMVAPVRAGPADWAALGVSCGRS